MVQVWSNQANRAATICRLPVLRLREGRSPFKVGNFMNLPVAIILITATVAGYFDLRWHRVPNWLVVFTMTACLIWHGRLNGLAGLGSSVAGLFLGTGLLFPLFLIRGMGAGDVKFFGALGAAIGYQHVTQMFITSAIIAALMAVLQVFGKWSLRETAANMSEILDRLLHGHLKPHPVANIDNPRAPVVHFSVSIAIAAWVFVLLKAA